MRGCTPSPVRLRFLCLRIALILTLALPSAIERSTSTAAISTESRSFTVTVLQGKVTIRLVLSLLRALGQIVSGDRA